MLDFHQTIKLDRIRARSAFPVVLEHKRHTHACNHPFSMLTRAYGEFQVSTLASTSHVLCLGSSIVPAASACEL